MQYIHGGSLEMRSLFQQRFRAELCHVDTLRCVVRVEAWQSDSHCVGSRLGEAANAEEAEDRARQRLIEALTSTAVETPTEPCQHHLLPWIHRHPRRQQQQPNPKPSPLTRVHRPQCHSSSLWNTPQDTDRSRRLERRAHRHRPRVETDRLGARPGTHLLERALSRRSAPLNALRRPGGLPAAVAAIPAWGSTGTGHGAHRRGDLISQGDQMLRDLGWSGEQARQFLDQHLKAKSRQQLSDERSQFNMLLEEQTIKAR